MEILVILVLVLFNGLFALSEMSLVSAKKARLTQMAESGSHGAATALELSATPDRFLSAVQVGITLIGTLSGAFGGQALAKPVAAWLAQFPVVSPYSSGLGFGLVVGGIAYLSLVLGELAPKRIALTRPEFFAARVAPLMLGVARLATPAVRLLSWSTRVVLRILGVRPSQEPPITEEELKLILAEGTQAGVFRASELDLMHRVLELEERPVARIMRPRSEVVWLDADSSPSENLARVRSGPHSRFPVCRGHLDDVMGVVRAQQLLLHCLDSHPPELRGLTDELLPPLLLPEHLSALQVLGRFRQSGVHLGLVVDEHGAVQGVVTVNDVMEALVGDLPVEGTGPEPMAVQREDGSWLLDGTLPLEDFLRLIDEELIVASYNTLAGFVIHRLGRIPRVGDSFRYQGRLFEVVDMDRHRVDRVLMTALEEEVSNEETGHGDPRS